MPPNILSGPQIFISSDIPQNPSRDILSPQPGQIPALEACLKDGSDADQRHQPVGFARQVQSREFFNNFEPVI
jgi:hypothetical protein